MFNLFNDKNHLTTGFSIKWDTVQSVRIATVIALRLKCVHLLGTQCSILYYILFNIRINIDLERV